MFTEKTCPAGEWEWNEVAKPGDDNLETENGCWNCNEENVCPLSLGDCGWKDGQE